MTDRVDDVPGDAPVGNRDRLARARAERAKREAAAAAEAEEAEIQRFDLVERFEKELGGREGREFAIVDVTALGEGFVVVKRGDAASLKAYQASKMNEVDTEAFVLPCVVHPAKDEYRKLAMARPLVPSACALALAGLYGAKATADAGK